MSQELVGFADEIPPQKRSSSGRTSKWVPRLKSLQRQAEAGGQPVAIYGPYRNFSSVASQVKKYADECFNVAGRKDPEDPDGKLGYVYIEYHRNGSAR